MCIEEKGKGLAPCIIHLAHGYDLLEISTSFPVIDVLEDELEH
jgi:hypothetical protein